MQTDLSPFRGCGCVVSVVSRLSARLIVFTRYPVAGRTKTRLIPALGPEGAAALQRRMTECTVAMARQLVRETDITLELRFAGGDAAAIRAWLAPDIFCLPQGPGNLGARLARAFGNAFAAGADRVLAIGSDCPAITPAILQQALAALASNELVLGPSHDGGYYLIGLRQHGPRLFEDIPWGSGAVLSRTLARARQMELSVALLDPLADIDRPEDLRFLPGHCRGK